VGTKYIFREVFLSKWGSPYFYDAAILTSWYSLASW